MNRHTYSSYDLDYPQSEITRAQQQKVLRNTYFLLALTMIPTVLGAWLSYKTGLATQLRGGISLIVFMVGAFGFIFMIEKNKNSGLGVALLLTFTFFMGVMLSRLLSVVLGNYSNGSQLIMTAFAGTAGIFASMAVLATSIKRDLSGAGKWLAVGGLVIMVSFLVNFFLKSTAMTAALSTAAIALFSFWIVFDIKRIIDGGETNYISATLGIYLSIFNIFQSLLALLGIFGGED